MKTNNEVTQSINEQQLSEVFKSWFTEEELKIMEQKYNKMLHDEKETNRPIDSID